MIPNYTKVSALMYVQPYVQSESDRDTLYTAILGADTAKNLYEVVKEHLQEFPMPSKGLGPCDQWACHFCENMLGSIDG